MGKMARSIFSKVSPVLIFQKQNVSNEREKIASSRLGAYGSAISLSPELSSERRRRRWAELESSLPEGFSKRVRDRGLVHVGWVPQHQILAHPSVSFYISRVGLSSVIEALVNDCQLVLLPMKSDQFFNSRLVGENGIMKSGVEVKRRDEDGYFEKEDISEAVKTVMIKVDVEPGRSIRMNQQKWRDFLVDKGAQDKFISNMILKMKHLLVDSIDE
ncbi:anthocyanidin-3-O-glucoside rhamnosyltransferase-like [Humulus lupulus]|uniref:anthocyanidin-3-O-glucoside rhamnosyltransferase-like n=1 Tax=Humulus lupulus TaxID=3486 RepID=UPI002B408E6E|nr:anthocyanidin-3-O-glucoside rhamnosyltransferase-like [Humulus lupulus]